MSNLKTISKILLTSMVCTIFVSYPNMLFLGMDWHCLADDQARGWYIHGLAHRLALFWIFTTASLLLNLKYLKSETLSRRIFPTIIFSIISLGVYRGIALLINIDLECRPIILTFQLVVIGMLGIFIGYTDYLSRIQAKKEEEFQQLKMESLQSRCTALTNQVNPHFFFNSLNGISSLVRKKDDKLTITYINHLSDIFRYILQSERKGMVTLEEELEFARSFSEVMQVRYAGKLDVTFDVPEESMKLEIPVLALLPLIENVAVHNMIDSEHRMNISIAMNDCGELVVCNPYFPKQYKSETHGTGLKNLNKRFQLLMDKRIRVESTDNEFIVVLPLAGNN